MTISTIPADRLPKLPAERHALLREYFCDIDAHAALTERGWDIKLAWPGGADRHVDPRLAEGLSWWGGGVTLPTMVHAHRRRGKILSTLYDTWTLHSWSEWALSAYLTRDENLVVLHVDDHRDLGSPRLFGATGEWFDAITGNPCRVDNPDSIRKAIQSGSIGMGSFMTPFLHSFPGTEVRHLCQPPKADVTRDFSIELTSVRDTLIDPLRNRPAVSLGAEFAGKGHSRYRLTSNTDDWLDDLGNRRILLHIDMDYFNNRYDGDTDWEKQGGCLDPSFDQILVKVDEVTSALSQRVGPEKLVDIVVAYSPGFFPAEYWAPATQRLMPGLERIHDR
ncbi:hypothetical protein GCM10007880_63400 [Mesorhizobium amorphae]|uniref:hypothetical protein n=1 Tax=Mesorhizobium amorphae TaxID=71433 RepID=UPI00235B9539|nr:hypothetical protein [Mesorhizobium amorphae]GLR45822.1 hypothetical protein GCM10007880_63400 [Mesorhizobium amorphae]